MKGKITIEVLSRGVFGLDVNIQGFSHFDRLATVDALVESMGFDDKDRVELGALIAIGGINAMKKGAMTKIAVSPELAELIRKKRGNDE